MSSSKRNRLMLLGTENVNLGGEDIAYCLKRSAKARGVRFQVNAETGLTVVIPGWFSKEELPALLGKHHRWILAKLKRLCQNKNSAARTLSSGDAIPYLGMALPLLIVRNPGDRDRCTLEGDKVIVRMGSETGVVDGVLEAWYRSQAARTIKAKVDELSARFGFVYNRLFIRGQSTRWGSCSRLRNLGFNWKLVLVPEPVLEYVIIHELAHLRELNHGKKFWELVEQYCPRWREHRKWLADHGNLADRPFTAIPVGHLPQVN